MLTLFSGFDIMARELKDYPQVVLKAPDLDEIVDFKKIFGRTNPLHIEIGSGRGTFIVSESKAFPQNDYLGIEWTSKCYRYAVDRLGRWNIANARLLRTEALFFLAHNIPPACADCLHIYFPDPWPKKKHNRRRFFSTQNLPLLLRCLKPYGTIKFVTDHSDYFAQAQLAADTASGLLEQIDFTPAAGAREGEFAGTNYERKYLAENRPIYHIALRKLN